MYELEISENAQQDIKFHKKSGSLTILKKIAVLLEELRNHPFTGTGKPEALKYELAPKWSRRINQEHRMVYDVEDNIVRIYSLKGHYQ
jgi:toxin YoeB